MLKVTNLSHAKRIARQYRPRFIQFVESVWDCPGPIPFDPKDRKHWQFYPKPPVYFAVRETDTHWYITYALYHRLDPASRHQHDFEGVMIVIDREHKCTVHTLSVSHLDLKFVTDIQEYENAYLRFEIEKGGHGIEWLGGADAYWWLKNHWEFYDYDLVCMDGKDFDWCEAEKMFGQWVKLPSQWHDRRLEVWVQQTKPTVFGERIETTRGLWLDRPDILIELFKRRKK